MDASYELAANIKTTGYDSLPADVIQITKKQILDTFGVALAGSAALGVGPLVALVKEWGGKEESTIIGYGGKVPAFHAAQVNATMAHALDYDDVLEGLIHPSACIVPTALAMAERKGNVSGKELITAVALGVDLSCRMSAATKLAKTHLIQGGWHFSALYGYYGAAATAGKILGLNAEQVVDALGIAHHQAAGNLQCLQDGAMTKRMGPGFAARAGIVAALLAERGVTGSKNTLEGERGIYNLYHAGLDRNKLLGGLGKHFEGTEISFKPYPCCRANHYYVDTVLRMVNDNSIRPEDIEGISTRVHPHTHELLCVPPEIKKNPRNIIDCQFSLPWSMGVAAARGKLGLSEFSEACLADPSLKSLVQKVNFVVDSTLPDLHLPVQVDIKTKNRGTISMTGKVGLGTPKNPLTSEALTDKFRGCAANSVKPLSAKKIEQIIQMINTLERTKDVSLLFKLAA